ncbi:MAG: hypothetical protein E7588_03575 [Ruminococcaceae bacterium]|nr:hypothetical protein [Oscillospiraceae bacterium]
MKSNLKRTVTMLLAAVMMLSAVCMMFTSCSDDKEITADIGETLSTRKPITLTVYGITGKTTTPEAIDEVEKRLNRFSESEYATTLELKLYDESEYRDILEAKYVKLQHDADVAKFCEGAKKIGDRVDKKMNKLLTEAEQSAKSAAAEKAAKEKAEAEAKAAAKLAAAIEAGEAVAEPVDEDQVDIVLISDFTHYMASINAQPEPVIVPLDEYLKLDSKILTDYIHPTLLSAAKIGGSTYGLPINKGIDADTTYCLLDRELVEKYQFDTTQIMNFANIESFLADVKANEPDVIPLLKAPEEVQGYDFYDNIIGHPIGITNPEFGEYVPVNCRSTYGEFVVTNFFEIMSDFREYGFLPDEGADTTGMRFAADIRKGNEQDVKRWEEEGYIVEVYKTARATTENTLGAMYAISAYSKYPARCMEILEMLYTDASFKNIFTFGVEGVNYSVNPDNTITRLNDEYMMDFMKSGNTFIGLLDEGMDPDYVAKAVAKNFGVKRHGFLAFQVELDEAGQNAIDYYTEYSDGVFETLRQGVPNPDLTYSRVASRLNRGYINDNVPGIKAFLNGEDDIPSEWAMQFDAYKTTIPANVTIEEKDLTSYIVSNKNK